MKTAKIIFAALVCALFAGCMDKDWDAPDLTDAPFGNNSLTEENVITIAELKDMYKDVFNASKDQAVKVDKDIKIKGWVVGNDIQGNIYKQVYVQDATGAILVGINEGGVFGYLPLGQEILIALKDLHVGAYRKQCQIGAPYNGSIGRMDKFTWQQHFKAIGKPNTDKLTELATEFNTDMDMFENCAKLMTFKNITLKDADGKATFAPADGSVTTTANCVNRNISEAKNVVLRTSTYADFAALPMPQGKVNITGIFTRYNNTWQILMRKGCDIEKQ